jgi:hypothetical protein
MTQLLTQRRSYDLITGIGFRFDGVSPASYALEFTREDAEDAIADGLEALAAALRARAPSAAVTPTVIAMDEREPE